MCFEVEVLAKCQIDKQMAAFWFLSFSNLLTQPDQLFTSRSQQGCVFGSPVQCTAVLSALHKQSDSAQQAAVCFEKQVVMEDCFLKTVKNIIFSDRVHMVRLN